MNALESDDGRDGVMPRRWAIDQPVESRNGRRGRPGDADSSGRTSNRSISSGFSAMLCFLRWTCDRTSISASNGVPEAWKRFESRSQACRTTPKLGASHERMEDNFIGPEGGKQTGPVTGLGGFQKENRAA
ncbi:hypothetical protein KM043_017256 [Ampulex compressa]|nr:hypothetical protein KM043_017256 [Ampulex compressa]